MIMNETTYITVYCGSSATSPDKYLAAAAATGCELARRGATPVTGAGRTGLMGAAADAALAAGGAVTGIIPEFMVRRGWNHAGLTELRVVESMHERKAMMAGISHGVIALPGGIGTFDELTEIITWRQLGLFAGNVVIYNVDGYYDPYISLLRHACREHFLKDEHLALFTVAESAADAVEAALAPCSPAVFTPKF